MGTDTKSQAARQDAAGGNKKRSLILGALAAVMFLASAGLLYSNMGGPREGIIPAEPGGAPTPSTEVVDQTNEDLDEAELEERFAQEYEQFRDLDPDAPAAIPGPGGKLGPSQYDDPE